MGFHSNTTTTLSLTDSEGGSVTVQVIDGKLVVTATNGANGQAATYTEETKSDAEDFAGALVDLAATMP